MKPEQDRGSRRRPRVLMVAALAVLVPLASQAQSGGCLSVTAPRPVVLPDGSIREAGPLRICLERDYTPVWSLHTVYFDGRMVGLYRARKSVAATEGDHPPYVAFIRTDEDALVLIGYGQPGNDRMRIYRLDPVPVVRVRTETAREGASSRLLLIARAD